MIHSSQNICPRAGGPAWRGAGKGGFTAFPGRAALQRGQLAFEVGERGDGVVVQVEAGSSGNARHAALFLHILWLGHTEGPTFFRF